MNGPGDGRDRRRGSQARRATAVTLEIGWWWSAAIGIWLLTLSSVTVPDLVVATCCGLPCALAARAGRMSVGTVWRPRLAWLAWAPVLAVAILADASRVLLVAMRRLANGPEPGEFREVPVRPGEHAPVTITHRAAATIAVSSTPGTLVAESDPAGKLVIHSLVSGWPHLDRVVAR